MLTAIWRGTTQSLAKVTICAQFSVVAAWISLGCSAPDRPLAAQDMMALTDMAGDACNVPTTELQWDDACPGWGLCARDACGYYFARQDADCLGSNECLIWGRCTASRGYCVVANELDCRKGAVCWEVDGTCTFDARSTPAGDGSCVATSDADCRAVGLVLAPSGSGCVQQGHTEADCAAYHGCKSYGTCHLVNGICLPLTDQDCTQSYECINKGKCHYSEERMACVAIDDAGCAASLECKLFNRCTAYHSQCWQTAADCKGDCGGRPCSFHYGFCQ